jgi:hypothetical protein
MKLYVQETYKYILCYEQWPELADIWPHAGHRVNSKCVTNFAS